MVRTVRSAVAFGSFVLLLVVGCSSSSLGASIYPHSGLRTLNQSPHEHRENIGRMENQRRLALVEDLDVFFQTDRPTRLMRWHGR